ncbi:MAG: M48 family metallopeptidase [Actinobacteria bacterium]|nr:M48 family metallopeptidase [Actinomycetota bacterium]
MIELIVFTLVAAFVLEASLEQLNQGSALKKPDPLVADLYDKTGREKSIKYGAEKNRSSLLSSALSLSVLILALTFGWFADLDRQISKSIDNALLTSLVFIWLLSVISWWISLPFTLYSTFSIEKRYGFNTTTLKLFIVDSVKGTLISLVIGGPVLALVIWLYQEFQGSFWIYAWALVAAVSLFMFMFGTKLILPLFNKLTPLPGGDLRTAISNYCDSQGYSLKNLYVMDGSKRSTKANAFFSGLGKSKTIVLFDTLIEKLTQDEIVAVLAHEIGHYKKRHTLASFTASNFQTFAIFALFGWALQYDQLSETLGAATPSFHLSALTFFILLTPLQIVFGLINNSLSRRNELAADTFAAQTYKRAPMRSALSKISTDSLSNLTPHPLYVAFNYTHPPLVARLRNVG